MVGRLFSFSDGLFSATMLVSGRAPGTKQVCDATLIVNFSLLANKHGSLCLVSACNLRLQSDFCFRALWKTVLSKLGLSGEYPKTMPENEVLVS